MSRTIQIQGSNEVMAMFGEPGAFYRGRWEKVRLTGLSKDEDTPLEVRTALIGMTIPTIFTKESIEEQTGTTFSIPKGSRLAYAADVIHALKSAGKNREAEQLRVIANGSLDMYVIDTTYELVSQDSNPSLN